MNQAQFANLQLVADSMEFAGLPNLGDDALIYAGSATWDNWRNHVPGILRTLWPSMTEEARLAVYLTAKQITMFNEPTKGPA